jgi:hypothetical protein
MFLLNLLVPVFIFSFRTFSSLSPFPGIPFNPFHCILFPFFVVSPCTLFHFNPHFPLFRPSSLLLSVFSLFLVPWSPILSCPLFSIFSFPPCPLSLVYFNPLFNFPYISLCPSFILSLAPLNSCYGSLSLFPPCISFHLSPFSLVFFPTFINPTFYFPRLSP